MWFVFGLCAAVLALVTLNAVAWPRVAARPAAPRDAVSVLIPARNEERQIAGALRAALAGGAGIREVLVYDDHSSDGTRAEADRVAASDARVRLLDPVALPGGWTGKAFACHRLALGAAGPWLLFLDADARLSPGGADRIVSEAEARGVSFLSAWPGIEMQSPAETLFMPLLHFVVFSLFPAPVSLFSRRPMLGLAHGACILARRPDYEAVGGHEAVRAELFEDTSLARAWRASGRQGICLDGQDEVRVRMYRTLGEIWAGFRKTFRPAFRSEAAFWLFLLFHAVLFVVPAGVALGTGLAGAPSRAALAAYGAGVLARLVQAVRFRFSLGAALFHPAAEAALLGLGLDSWARFRFGRGVAWKGRSYREGALR